MWSNISCSEAPNTPAGSVRHGFLCWWLGITIAQLAEIQYIASNKCITCEVRLVLLGDLKGPGPTGHRAKTPRMKWRKVRLQRSFLRLDLDPLLGVIRPFLGSGMDERV